MYHSTASNITDYIDTHDQRRARNEGLRATLEGASRDDLLRMLLTCQKTGLPNGIAWECADRKAIMVMIDLDSLKWVNDNHGHPAGDGLLRAFGKEMTIAGVQVYHVSGDEFYAQFDDVATATHILTTLQEKAKDWTFTNGDHTWKGVGFSFGCGAIQKDAEDGMIRMKADREIAGLRASRGEKPVCLVAVV